MPEQQSMPTAAPPPSMLALMLAEVLVKFYDGDQVDHPVVDLCGHFLIGLDREIDRDVAGEIRLSVAKRIDAFVRHKK